MRVLERKSLRDLRRLWAQTLAIALVLGCGIMVMVGAQATQATLIQTQAAYYDRHRFADIFAGATRAPAAIVQEAALIPGVAQAEGRITGRAVLDVPGMAEPATARILSVAQAGAALNLPLLRRGRLPDPARPDEIALSEAFAALHGLLPGMRLDAVLNGQRRALIVTGWVLSPEFIYVVPPGGLMPDDRRHAVIWMTRDAAAAAFGMQGAVNDLALRLTRDADPPAVIAALDGLLDPFGGTGAHDRTRQVSHAFLDGELQQLGALAVYIPPIFLIVSAFLVHMVLGRLIALERVQIGLFKALGYGRLTIGGHYLTLAVLIGVIGVLAGWGFGWWIADLMIGMYGEYFRFPFMLRDWGGQALGLSAVLGMATVCLGALRAVWSVLRLPPAEAMQPPPPPRYTRGIVDRWLRGLRLRQTTMMILRSILRWPGRAAITLLGVAASVAALVMSYFLLDAVALLGDAVFQQANRQQVTLVLTEARSDAALADALTLPGVLRAEGGYGVPIRASFGHHSRLTALQGHFPDATLARLVDDRGAAVSLPAEGVILSEMLARHLRIAPGQRLRIEMLAAPRIVLEVPVAGIIQQGLGQEVHIAAAPLFRAMDSAPQVNTIHLAVRADQMAALQVALKQTPAIAGLMDWSDVRRQFDATLRDSLLTTVLIYTLIGVLIAIGVIYNAARIQVSERSHELASLRMLGFSRAEVGYVLIGEMMLLTLLAIPVGWGLGVVLVQGMAHAVSTDLVQIPLYISKRTYALAALAVSVAALGSVLIVRRRLDRIDLAMALKARD